MQSERSPPEKRSGLRGSFGPLAVTLLAGWFLVPPLAVFPLNDEWLFRSMVDTLVGEHRYVQHPYVQPTSVALVLWGALFERLFGPGMPILRLSVVPFALLAVWATVQCARACGLARIPALLCGLVLLVDPIFFSLSTTYMTDVPSCALSTLSAWFYLRALRDGRAGNAFWGSMAGGVGFFVRQVTCLPAIAYALVALVSAARRPRVPGSRNWRPVAAYGLPWILAALGFWWWKVAAGVAGDWRFPDPPSLALRLLHAPIYLVIVVSTLGLLLAPLALARFYALTTGREQWPRAAWIVFAVQTLLSGGVFVAFLKMPLPQIGPFFDFCSMGPRALLGQPIATPDGFRGVYLAWCAATVFGVLSGSLLTVTVLQFGRRFRCVTTPNVPFDGRPAWFLGVWAAASLAISNSPLTDRPSDRYLLPLLGVCAIPMAARLGQRPGRGTLGLCLASLLAVYGYSIGVRKEYLGWNGARWEAATQLLDGGIPAAEIDGGYEFNGIYKSEEYRRLKGPRPFWFSFEDEVWWPLRDRYRIAFSPLADHSVIGRFAYFSWFTRTDRYVYVLAMPAAPK